MRDFGLSNVVIKNISREIKAGRISDQELDQLIDHLKIQIEAVRQQFKNDIVKLNTCQHEFAQTTYTKQSRIVGYATVYERKCKKCGFVEHFQSYSEHSNVVLPDWTAGARQQYYNNFI
jgi:hypothetical protein